MKTKSKTAVDTMRTEYNFDYSKGVRGKYYKRIIKEGTNVVLLDPNVWQAFPDSSAVNHALRSVLRSRRTRRNSSGRIGRRKVAQSAR